VEQFSDRWSGQVDRVRDAAFTSDRTFRMVLCSHPQHHHTACCEMNKIMGGYHRAANILAGDGDSCCQRRSRVVDRKKSLVHLFAFVVLIHGLPVLCASCWAHDSWISRDNLRDPLSGVGCCGDQDCEDLSKLGVTVTEQPSGFVLSDTNEQVEKRRVIWKSREGHWYRCFEKVSTRGGPTWKRVRCLIGPPPQS